MCIVAEEAKTVKALQTSGWLRPIGVFAALLVGFPAIAAAQTIYIGTGEQGETSFSDQPPVTGQPTATVTLEPAAPMVRGPSIDGQPVAGASAINQGSAQIDQMLTVAAALEASRIQREAQRAEARSARRAADQPVPAQPAAVGGTVPWWLLQQRRRGGLGGFYQDGTVYHDPRLRPQAPFRSGFGDPRFGDPRYADRDYNSERSARGERSRAAGPTRSSPLIVD